MDEASQKRIELTMLVIGFRDCRNEPVPDLLIAGDRRPEKPTKHVH
jgi:hypothetical protein